MNTQSPKHGDDLGIQLDAKYGEIKPGAAVTILTKEVITIPKDAIGIVDVREHWAKLGLCITSQTIWSGYNGQFKLHLTNRGSSAIYIRDTDKLTHLAILQAYK